MNTPTLKRPDLEFFIPEAEVLRTGSHAGIFQLAQERAAAALPGQRIKMWGHQPMDSPARYVIYVWRHTNE